jgi:hypothetical protein
VVRRRVAIALALASVAAPGSAQAGEDSAAAWRELHRPLDLPELAPGEPCPVSPIDESVDWESTGIFGGSGTGPGPVYPGLGSSEGTLTLTPEDFRRGWYGEKVFWYVAPSYPGRALIRGERIDGPTRLKFSGSFLPRIPREMRLAPGGGTTWSGRPPGSRGFPSGVYMRGPGCYAVQIDGTRFSRTVVFSATGASY